MKNWIDKLKSADYKQLAVDHGEKIVAGVLGLFLLFALLGTSWSRYERTPDDLTSMVESARAEIGRRGWPEQEQSKFPESAGVKQEDWKSLLPATEAERELEADRNLAKYQIDNAPLVFSIYRRKRRIREPAYLAVEDLRVTPTRVLLALSDESDEAQLAAAQGADPAENQQNGNLIKEPFRPDPAAPQAAPGVGQEPASYSSSSPRAEGRRCNCVRGIFPLRRQIKEIAAKSDLSESEVESLVQLHHYELERQYRKADGTWSEWEEVDASIAEETVREAADWESEVVDIGVTDLAITMPLPSRVIRYWSKEEVSHPQLEQYELPPKERERQLQMAQALISAHQKQQEQLKQSTKGGWGRYGHDPRQYRQQLLANTSGQQAVQVALAKVLESSDSELDTQSVAQLAKAIVEQQQSAVGNLLLFRYLDFDVKPGWTYRYRARIVLNNPFYQRPLKDVATPDVSEGRFRKTPMSRPTEPVTVPKDTRLFLTRVRPGPALPKANFDVFQWSTEVGTTINETLTVDLGQYIGGRKTTEVAAPAEEAYGPREMEFKSTDVLIDVAAVSDGPETDLYADLQLSPTELRAKMSAMKQALIQDEFGRLTTFRAASDRRADPDFDPSYRLAQDELESEHKPIRERYGDTGAAEADEFEYYYPTDTASDGRSGRRGGRNPMRRGGFGGP